MTKPLENFVVYSVICWQFVVFPLSDWVASFCLGIIDKPGLVYFLMIAILEMTWLIVVYYIVKRWLSDTAEKAVNKADHDNKDNKRHNGGKTV